MLIRLALIVVGLSAALAAPAIADSDGPIPPVDVIEMQGPVDRLLVDFVIDRISDSDAQLIVLQIDSPGAVDADVVELIDLIESSPVPIGVWVGPAPASARGGVAQLLVASPISGAAPGVTVGKLSPTVAGHDTGALAVAPEGLEGLLFAEIEVVAPIDGLIDRVTPSIGQFIVGLDELAVELRDGIFVLDTAAVVVEEGVEVIKPLAEVRFIKPDVMTRTLRLALRPEAIFFFLTAGFAFAAFEFYAVGPGVAAGVAAASMLLAGYGIAVVPIRPLALAAIVSGLVLYTIDFQRNDIRLPSLLGTAALGYGGLTLVDGSGQLSVAWWAVVVTLAGIALFFMFAMTTVVRARFSTATIGRDHLLGRPGVADSDLQPEGFVTVDGARWRARSHRAAGIRSGDAVTVAGIDGIVLEVDPR